MVVSCLHHGVLLSMWQASHSRKQYIEISVRFLCPDPGNSRSDLSLWCRRWPATGPVIVYPDMGNRQLDLFCWQVLGEEKTCEPGMYHNLSKDAYIKTDNRSIIKIKKANIISYISNEY